MRKILFLIPAAFLSLLLSPSANADVQSCTNQIIKNLNSGPHTYESGKVVATEVYQGVNYHLIFLDGGWSEAEMVIKENSSTCEQLVYDPVGHGIPYAKVMPTPVAKNLELAAREYHKAIGERMKSNQ